MFTHNNLPVPLVAAATFQQLDSKIAQLTAHAGVQDGKVDQLALQMAKLEPIQMEQLRASQKEAKRQAIEQQQALEKVLSNINSNVEPLPRGMSAVDVFGELPTNMSTARLMVNKEFIQKLAEGKGLFSIQFEPVVLRERNVKLIFSEDIFTVDSLNSKELFLFQGLFELVELIFERLSEHCGKIVFPTKEAILAKSGSFLDNAAEQFKWYLVDVAGQSVARDAICQYEKRLARLELLCAQHNEPIYIALAVRNLIQALHNVFLSDQKTFIPAHETLKIITDYLTKYPDDKKSKENAKDIFLKLFTKLPQEFIFVKKPQYHNGRSAIWRGNIFLLTMPEYASLTVEEIKAAMGMSSVTMPAAGKDEKTPEKQSENHPILIKRGNDQYFILNGNLMESDLKVTALLADLCERLNLPFPGLNEGAFLLSEAFAYEELYACLPLERMHDFSLLAQRAIRLNSFYRWETIIIQLFEMGLCNAESVKAIMMKYIGEISAEDTELRKSNHPASITSHCERLLLAIGCSAADVNQFVTHYSELMLPAAATNTELPDFGGAQLLDVSAVTITPPDPVVTFEAKQPAADSVFPILDSNQMPVFFNNTSLSTPAFNNLMINPHESFAKRAMHMQKMSGGAGNLSAQQGDHSTLLITVMKHTGSPINATQPAAASTNAAAGLLRPQGFSS